MSSSDITVIPPGGALAYPKKLAPMKVAIAGHALVNAELSSVVVQAMVASDGFRVDVQHDDDGSRLVDGRNYLGQPLPPKQQYLDLAKPFFHARLTDTVHAAEASRLLFDIACTPRRAVTPTEANAMLCYLFGAMGKRRSDEATVKLMACCDIFSPASNALGVALKLWKPVPRHPVILALAIKELMAAKTFEPAETELREALGKVCQQLQMRQDYTARWLNRIEYADNTVFTFDRPAWDAAYANVPSAVAQAMQDQLEYEESGGEDDDGIMSPPSPRWQALEDLIDAKARLAESMHEAACEAKPAKRTSKPKRNRRTPPVDGGGR